MLALLVFVVTIFVLHHAIHSGLDSVRQDLVAKGRTRNAETFTQVEGYLWLLPLFEGLGLGLALLQLPFSYTMIRLDYEQRWYLVTDRSLRLRHGLWNVREMTLSFANIQQTTLRQGPLQRLLGLADLVVTTAGGGSLPPGHEGGAPTPWHTGVLRAVDNAEEIRDLIQERLRRLKSAGLGDHDDPENQPPAAVDPMSHPTTNRIPHPASVEAARELLKEIRALRGALKPE